MLWAVDWPVEGHGLAPGGGYGGVTHPVLRFTFPAAYNAGMSAMMRFSGEDDGSPRKRPQSQWTFLTNHAHVLLCIARNPGIRLRDVANAVGITERAAQRIVADLEAAAYLSHTKVGRRNQYQVHADRPLRHPVEHDHAIGDLLDVLAAERK
jgi:hypothetical protein